MKKLILLFAPVVFNLTVHALFKSRESRTDRIPYKGHPYGGLIIDVRGSEISGISARFLRFVRSSYELKLDVCVNATIIGKKKPIYPTGRPDLMLWETKFPPQPYW